MAKGRIAGTGGAQGQYCPPKKFRPAKPKYKGCLLFIIPLVGSLIYLIA